MRSLMLLLALLSLVACGDTSEIDNAPKATVHGAVKAAPTKAPETDAPPDPAEGEAAAAGEAHSEPGSAPVATPLTLDPAASSIGFVGAKITGTHDGGFKGFTGAMSWAAGAPSGLTVDVDMGSLFADHPKLEKHLKSADFFDVVAKPAAGFVATTFTHGEGSAWTVAGTLTLNGASREISFPATISKSDGALRAQATFQINRQDFGITYPGKPDDLIKDEVALRVLLVFPEA